MFHKVVLQHIQSTVGFLIKSLLKIYQEIFEWKKVRKSIKILQNYGHSVVVIYCTVTGYIQVIPATHFHFTANAYMNFVARADL